MRTALRSMIGFTALLAAGAANAGDVSFTADALERHPTSGMRSGRLYVSGTSSRFEFQRMGTPVVEIDLPTQGVRRIVFPATKTYLEFRGPPRTLRGNEAPCLTTAYQTCRKVGEENHGGVEAEIWSLGISGTDDAVRIWWDPERRMTVREEYPGGYRMHALKRSHENYEKHEAEQWEFTYLLPYGRYLGGMAIIVPDLKTPVVERRPDGLIRRLVNIEQRDVDASRFEAPAGFRRIELPNPPPPGYTPPPLGWQPMSTPPRPSRPDAPVAVAPTPSPYPQMTQGDTARR